MLDFLKVFFYGVSIDILYVFYILFVSRRMKFRAATFSMLMAAPAIFGFLDIYEKRWLAIPYLLGLFSGTIAAMMYDDYVLRKKKVD